MRWANAISTRPSLEAAMQEVIESCQSILQVPADLGMIFISASFASEYSRLMPLLQEWQPAKVLVGCSGAGIIGMDNSPQVWELEQKPAISLVLASLPGVQVQTFHLSAEDLPDLDSSPDAWCNLINVPNNAHPHFILMADPFSARINDLIQGLDYAYPGSVKVGGLASGGGMGQSAGLFCNYEYYTEGSVGLVLLGNITMETIVAQGCRPIGKPYRVNQGEKNIILEVTEIKEDGQAGKTQPPLFALQDLIENLSEEDQDLAQNSLFVGMVGDEFKQDLQPGDFLIRNLLGVDPRVGAIAIGDHIRQGQRIQFHLRDAKTSAEDLEMLLERYAKPSNINEYDCFGLMFACVGRGEGLYGKPHFDARLFRRYLDIPVSGFFCNGEIGPVGGSTFLHGYTSAFGILRPLSL
jgi:small ligand-binding sensory domain FIST